MRLPVFSVPIALSIPLSYKSWRPNGGYRMSKFFTYEDRHSLQKYLKASLSFKEIARRIDKNPTTISREVCNYSSLIATGYPGFTFNACKSRFDCRKKKVCGKECTRKSDSIVSFANPVIQTV